MSHVLRQLGALAATSARAAQISRIHNHMTAWATRSLSASPALRYDAVKLAYSKSGTGPEAVAIVHGLYGRGRNLKTVADGIEQVINGKVTGKTSASHDGSHHHQTSAAPKADRFSVYTVDLRNHGDSAHAATMTYPEMAFDIQELMHSLGHHQVSLVGHSLGGKTSMTLALMNPSFVSKLVVVDIAPNSYSSSRESFRVIGYLKNMPLGHADGQVHTLKQADEYLKYHIPNIAVRGFLLQNLVLSKTSSPTWKINVESINNALPHLSSYTPQGFAPFQGPVMFLKGAKSDYIKPSLHGEFMTQLFPKHQLVSVDADHWVHFDQPKEFVRHVSQFILDGTVSS